MGRTEYYRRIEISIPNRKACGFMKPPEHDVKFLSVIPAKAGIQVFQLLWTPASAGVTVYSEKLYAD